MIVSAETVARLAPTQETATQCGFELFEKLYNTISNRKNTKARKAIFKT
jgi:hypothetical protein